MISLIYWNTCSYSCLGRNAFGKIGKFKSQCRKQSNLPKQNKVCGMSWMHEKSMSHLKLISVKGILPVSGQLIISGHEVLQNLRIKTSMPLGVFIPSLEEENKFPYVSNPNWFLTLKELTSG